MNTPVKALTLPPTPRGTSKSRAVSSSLQAWDGGRGSLQDAGVTLINLPGVGTFAFSFTLTVAWEGKRQELKMNSEPQCHHTQ
ncbi:hypothetical protein PoB_002199800 [Plakobranchus ocellatus]|uniref:Uncharacterized protein n=1 Tax=Plakobranchus ocellatus TaxID=259542 RepID=A0AAV3ZKW6_9GAST|nr:hypothetical protein PoB_002199800 [Plakobranchus ocellatus]